LTTEIHELPEIGELVIATITKIGDHGAYVILDEYDKIQGFLHVSEIAPGWVRNINKYVKENEKALNSFEKSLQVNSSLTEAYYQIAQIHLTVKNHDAALKSIENAIKFSPTNQTYQKFQEKIIASQTKSPNEPK